MIKEALEEANIILEEEEKLNDIEKPEENKENKEQQNPGEAK